MRSQTARDDWLVPAIALSTVVLWDTIGVWIPSLLFIAGDAGATPATTFGGIALATVSVPLVLAALAAPHLVPRGWTSAIAVLVVARVGLQIADGGTLQLVVASLGMMAGGVVLAAAASGAPSGWRARLGIVLGSAAAIVLRVAAGGVDVVWRHGAGAMLAALTLAGATAYAAYRALPQLDTSEDAPARAGTALAWWSVGPVLLLLGILVAPPGRVAAATGWPDGLVAATTVGLAGAMIASYVVTRRFSARMSAGVSALTVVLGTLGALRADAPVTVLGQFVLALGLGGALGAVATLGAASSRARAVAGAGSLVLFVTLGFAHYTPYDVTVWFTSRAVLLATALIVAAATALHARPTQIAVTRERSVSHRLTAIAVATGLTAVLAATTAPATPIDEVRQPAARTDATLRLALINLRMGFDLEGRLGVDDLAAELAALQPDVVVLNEVDRGWLTTGGRDTLRIVQRAVGHDAIFAPAADDVWGNALLTHHAWEDVDRARLPQGRDAMARGQVSALVTTTAGKIAVVGTHLSHVDDRGDTRVPQARAVAATVARYAARGIPTIVAGDFNAALESAELNAFGDFVRSAFADGRPTWPADDPQVQIDHVLVSPEFVVDSARHFGEDHSDHVGLVVDLTLRGPT